LTFGSTRLDAPGPEDMPLASITIYSISSIYVVLLEDKRVLTGLDTDIRTSNHITIDAHLGTGILYHRLYIAGVGAPTCRRESVFWVANQCSNLIFSAFQRFIPHVCDATTRHRRCGWAFKIAASSVHLPTFSYAVHRRLADRYF
jgi:hypothetical protein